MLREAWLYGRRFSPVFVFIETFAQRALNAKELFRSVFFGAPGKGVDRLRQCAAMFFLATK